MVSRASGAAAALGWVVLQHSHRPGGAAEARQADCAAAGGRSCDRDEMGSMECRQDRMKNGM